MTAMRIVKYPHLPTIGLDVHEAGPVPIVPPLPLVPAAPHLVTIVFLPSSLIFGKFSLTTLSEGLPNTLQGHDWSKLQMHLCLLPGYQVAPTNLVHTKSSSHKYFLPSCTVQEKAGGGVLALLSPANKPVAVTSPAFVIPLQDCMSVSGTGMVSATGIGVSIPTTCWVGFGWADLLAGALAFASDFATSVIGSKIGAKVKAKYTSKIIVTGAPMVAKAVLSAVLGKVVGAIVDAVQPSPSEGMVDLSVPADAVSSEVAQGLASAEAAVSSAQAAVALASSVLAIPSALGFVPSGSNTPEGARSAPDRPGGSSPGRTPGRVKQIPKALITAPAMSRRAAPTTMTSISRQGCPTVLPRNFERHSVGELNMADDPFGFLENFVKPEDLIKTDDDKRSDEGEKDPEAKKEEEREKPKDWDEMPDALEESGLEVAQKALDTAGEGAKEKGKEIGDSALEDIKNGRVPDVEKLAGMALEGIKDIAHSTGAAAIDEAKKQAKRQVDNALSIVSNEFPLLGGILGLLSKPLIDYALKQVEMPEF
jgi:hypothetical protein